MGKTQTNINETRLSNGLVVLTDRMEGVRSATLGFLFRVGARNESEGFYGISHFIEHAVFKGTKRRSVLDIAVEQDRLGGSLDAFTTHEETGFFIKVIDEDLGAAFDLLADMLTEPLFAEADLAAEQKVIIEEMKMIEDLPEDFLGDLFNEAFYPGHPLGRPIPGTPESVLTFGRETTARYHADLYNPSNLIVAAAGNVDHEAVLSLVEAKFGGPAGRTAPETSRPVTAAPLFVRRNTNLEQAHWIAATPFPDARDDRRYAADLLASALGGGTSSRLWQAIREERGLAYSVGASASMYQDTGAFSIYAATSPDQAKDALRLAIAEIRHVLADGITEAELQIAKQQERSSILMGLENSAERAASLAQSEMVHGRQITVEETLANIDTVTTGECHAVAAEFFRTDAIGFGALGDLDEDSIERGDLALD